MAIHPTAIKKFLNRKLENYDWLKEETTSSLDAALNELNPVPDFKGLSLWTHQKAVLLILLELRRFMLHVDMGGGKTLSVLALVSYLKQSGYKPRAIVFIPYVTTFTTWLDEVAERTPHLKIVPLNGTKEQNLRSMQEDEGDLFVIPYPSAVAMVSETVKNKRTKKNEWNFKAQDVREYFSSFNIAIFDEIHKAKNVSSLTYRMCRAIAAQCDYVLGLTGTPFNKDVSELWPQFYLIDFGETLGSTLSFYKAAFFKEGRNNWGGYEYTFKKKLLPILQEIIKNASISYGIEELHDMPKRRWLKKRIKAPDSQQGYADAAKARINAARKGAGLGALQTVQSSYMQMRQLSSGFMTLKGGDTNRVEIEFDDNPKLDMLIDLIESMPATSKMVVFHHFIYTNHLISKRLKKSGIEHARVWSGQTDPVGELNRFKIDPECYILLLNDRMGSSSLNLQHANYVTFFEQPDSSIDRQQAERRVWRPGQKNTVIYYDLFVTGTYDESMNASNKAGESLLKQLLRGVK